MIACSVLSLVRPPTAAVTLPQIFDRAIGLVADHFGIEVSEEAG
jgi:hypothetical protein